jgi:hypothetical protein
MKRVFNDQGLGTVELVILIAILICIALIFKNHLIDFVNALIDKNLDVDSIEISIKNALIT